VLVHYGPTRARSAAEFASYDVVITSYGTLASEYDGLLQHHAAASEAAQRAAWLSRQSHAAPALG
jgi:hypothetical protein